MKARDVSVSVSDFGGELFIIATMRVTGSLEKEAACPEPKNPPPNAGTRVRESSRKAKAKELRKFLEGVEFPDGT